MTEMLQCPGGCGVELPEDDLRAQIEHMEQNHPEIIKERLQREGLWNRQSNEPMYPKPNDPLAQH